MKGIVMVREVSISTLPQSVVDNCPELFGWNNINAELDSADQSQPEQPAAEEDDQGEEEEEERKGVRLL